METTDTPQTTPATNNETAHPPQPTAPATTYAERHGMSREQYVTFLAELEEAFKVLGWDIRAHPPDDAKVPGSDKMFALILSVLTSEEKPAWEYKAILSEMDQVCRQIVADLGRRLAQPLPFANDLLELRRKIETREFLDLMLLAQRKDLTRPECERLSAELDKRYQADQRQLKRFVADATKSLEKKKKRAR